MNAISLGGPLTNQRAEIATVECQLEADAAFVPRSDGFLLTEVYAPNGHDLAGSVAISNGRYSLLAVPMSAFRAGWFSLGDVPIYVDKTGLTVSLLVSPLDRDGFDAPIAVHLKGVAIRRRGAQTRA